MIEILIAFQIKHFLCDYPLQGKYMLGKFKPFPGFIFPLLAHAAVHAFVTFCIVYYYLPELALKMALLDGALHFIIDRIKASPNLLGRFKALSGNEYINIATKNQEYENNLEKETTPELGKKLYSTLLSENNKKLQHNTYFWWALGADQFLHHLTHYLIIYLCLKSSA